MKNSWKKHFACFGLGLLGCAAAASASAKMVAPRVIWAKADVSSVQYHADALECGMQGLSENIDSSEEVKALARASKQLEAVDSAAQTALSQGAAQMGRQETTTVYVQNGLDIAASKAAEEQAIIAATRPAEKYASIKELMFKVVRTCMINNGYVKVVLTDDQREKYINLKGGIVARRAYIHELASDKHVLATQREVVANEKMGRQLAAVF